MRNFCFCLALFFANIVLKVRTEDETCEITACEAIEQSKIDLQEYIDGLEDRNNNTAILKLERRVRSLEQPVWKISTRNERWMDCGKGPCKCRPETKSLTCWQQHISILSAGQTLPQDIISIDLGINGLTTLHRDTFVALTHLSELDLFNNELDFLPEGIFDDLDGLKYLRLHKNKLEDVGAALLLKLRHLQTLDMSSNEIKHIPAGFFSGNSKIIVLHLTRNKIKIIPETLLNGLVHLEDLDLSTNRIERIPKFLFAGISSMKRLQLAENRIDYLPDGVFDAMVDLELLNLRKNHISSVSEKLFAKLESLRVLLLTSNHLKIIQSRTFQGVGSLEELHLGQNFISELPENCFLGNSYLKKLFLFSNNLEELKPETFNGLNNLTTLLLNNNILRSIDANIFSFVANLEKLDLDSNNFHFLPAKCLEPLTNLVSIKLAKNPWRCDCHILYLGLWVDKNKNKVWDIQPTCRGPPELSGSLLEELGFNELCGGQWASMLNLSPRVPVIKHGGAKANGSEEP